MTHRNPYYLVSQLARAVAHARLDPGHAMAALLVMALRRERADGIAAPGTFRLAKHLYRQYLDRALMDRAIADMHARWEKRHAG